MFEDIQVLLEKIQTGDKVALGKAITLIESTLPEEQKKARRLLAELHLSQRTLCVAISGSPGVGKSTFVNVLGRHLIEKGYKIAVLAIDPSSMISRGSILGDKTRMQQLGKEARAFIRPSPTSGNLGGIGAATFESTLLCREAGFDFVLIETVGIGQTEILARFVSDVFILLLQPGAGDELQSLKKGVLEYVDLLLVNKWDHDLKLEAEKTKSRYQSVWPGDQGNIYLISALEDKGIDQVSEFLIGKLVEPEHKNALPERERFWFIHRTKRLLMERMIEKEATLIRELEDDILTGDKKYSEAIEEALNRICPI
ncbi:MAG: ATP/GTP-binding protein [Saprospiraceae bacterium]|nr:ATP/GTP-binding protein [Saprospiraceae bacterium]